MVGITAGVLATRGAADGAGLEVWFTPAWSATVGAPPVHPAISNMAIARGIVCSARISPPLAFALGRRARRVLERRRRRLRGRRGCGRRAGRGLAWRGGWALCRRRLARRARRSLVGDGRQFHRRW